MLLKDCIQIQAPAESAFNFFQNMADNYVRWHPDHLKFAWLEGDSVEVGSVFYFEERIGNELEKKAMRFTAVKQNRFLEFTPVSKIVRFFMPKLRFAMDPVDENSCHFTATINLRVGPILPRIYAKEFDVVRQHMREEGKNLKSLLEAK